MNVLSALWSLASQPQPLPRRIWRKAQLILHPDKRMVFKLEDGSLYECALGTSAGRLLTLHQLETVERQFVHDTLQPGDIFFDVGANNGIFTITAARRVGNSGHVYAFEASRREVAMLQH